MEPRTVRYQGNLPQAEGSTVDGRQRATAVSSLTSSRDSSTEAAATLSSRCGTDPVPGMGRIDGERASSQASTTWCGVAPCRCATRVTASRPSMSWMGAHGRNTICSCSHRSTSDSDCRSSTLYRFWMDTIGVTRWARRSCSSFTLDRPMCRILPCSFSITRVPSESSSGTRGSGRWNWYSGICSRRSRCRLPSHAATRCSGRPLAVHCPGPGRSRPPLVAMTRSSGYGCSASAISRSLTSGP